MTVNLRSGERVEIIIAKNNLTEMFVILTYINKNPNTEINPNQLQMFYSSQQELKHNMLQSFKSDFF